MKKEKEFFVYILFSNIFEKFYVGMTNNLNRRIKQHNSKQVLSTKAFVPWSIIYNEKFETRTDARQREKYLKSAAGRRWRKNNFNLIMYQFKLLLFF